MTLRRVPIHRALVRPQTMLGGERTLVFAAALLGIMLAGPAGVARANVGMVVLGLAFFFACVLGLGEMYKRDPQMSRVFMRAMLYEQHYTARARWDQPAPKLRRTP
jgi:type IV secretion system protein VirB3